MLPSADRSRDNNRMRGFWIFCFNNLVGIMVGQFSSQADSYHGQCLEAECKEVELTEVHEIEVSGVYRTPTPRYGS